MESLFVFVVMLALMVFEWLRSQFDTPAYYAALIRVHVWLAAFALAMFIYKTHA